MFRQFKAADETEMTFKMVEEIDGCQRFKISVEGKADRLMILVGSDTEAHYNTLELLLAWGIYHFETLPCWHDSVERII